MAILSANFEYLCLCVFLLVADWLSLLMLVSDLLLPFNHLWLHSNKISYLIFPRLMLFGHLIRMDESADARRILTAVPQSDWRRPVGRPHSSWMATLKNDLSLHNLTFEDAIEMALDKPLWRLLAARATH